MAARSRELRQLGPDTRHCVGGTGERSSASQLSQAVEMAVGSYGDCARGGHVAR